jgi:2-haloacid dehalogenase
MRNHKLEKPDTLRRNHHNHLAIVFDFGGVLLDWDPRYLYRKLFPDDEQGMERFLNEVGFYEWNHQQDAGRSFSEAVADLCKKHPGYCDLIRAYDTRWEESISGPIQPNVELLQRLKLAGYPLYGLSNWSVEKFNLARYKYEFLDWFEDILISGEVKINKPDPRIFDMFLQRIGRAAPECLFIDDSADNVATAQNLGFLVIHYRSPGQLTDHLHTMGISIT